VAYNPTANEYLVVWEADHDADGVVNGEQEIWGQRIRGDTGGEVGVDDFRISDMGIDGVSIYDATRPDVAYNASEDEYLVVWQADDDAGGISNGETEIFAQRLDGSGAEVGPNDIRISDVGNDGNDLSDAGEPAVATTSGQELLVVWHGDETAGPLVDDEFEIYGQRFGIGVVTCLGDNTGDGFVDVLDLINVIIQWGSANPDVDGNDDGIVDVLDLVDVILNWGPCA
jgi:hypothetical protein